MTTSEFNPGLSHAMSVSSLAAVPASQRMLLTSTNYSVWSTYMECELDNIGVFDIVNGPFFLKPDSPAEDLTNFNRLERKAYNLMIRHLDEVNLGLVTAYAVDDNMKTGSGLWAYLQEKYMSNNIFHQSFVFAKFIGIKFQTQIQFVSDVRISLSELKRVGLNLSDPVLVVMILAKLPKELESLVRVLSHNVHENFDPAFILLRLEQDAQQQSTMAEGSVSGTALVSAGNKNPNHVCTHCKRSGHLEPRCWILHPDLKPTFGRGSKKAAANVASTSASTSSDPTPKPSTPQGTPAAVTAPAAMFAGMDLNDPLSANSPSPDSTALVSDVDTPISSILDSGCSDVMYKSLADFSIYTPHSSKVNIGEVGRSVESVGFGTVYVIGAGGVITFEKALHVPLLPYNLISLSTLWKKGAQVVHHMNGTFSVFLNNRLVFDGFLKNRLPFVNLRVLRTCNSSPSSFSFNLWHERLGHINPQYVRDTSKVTTGMTGKDSSHFCESCAISRSTRVPFSGQLPRPGSPLDTVHTDLSGRISPATPSGFEYFMKITDGCSSYRWIYLLRFKSEALEKLKEWKLQAEKLTGLKVRRIISDGGGEYVNKLFDEFVRSEGITHQYTAPHTPHQNPISERGNRTTNEKARTMLHRASMPAYMWGAAVLAAVYLENRTVSKACGGKTPFEALSGKAPSVGHLRVFGCAAYRHIVHGRDGKFGPRAEKLVLVGYVEGMKNYRLFNPLTGAIVTSHDVRFDEDAFPFKELSGDAGLTIVPFNEEEVLGRAPLVIRLQNPVIADEIRKENDDLQAACALVSSLGNTIDDDDNLATLDLEPNPATYSKVLKSKNAEKWKKATFDEFDSFLVNDVFEIIDSIPHGHRPISTRWVYNRKFDEKGFLSRFKGRCVARGFLQKEGVDYEETFSPTGRLATLRGLFSMAASEDLEISQADFVTAFLNSPLGSNETVYVKIPDGFVDWVMQLPLSSPLRSWLSRLVDDPGNCFLKLRKSVYGLKQASRSWYLTVRAWFLEHGFVVSDADACLFVRGKDGEDRTFIYIWVDDIVVVGRSVDWVLRALRDDFRIKDLGPVGMMLGMKITRDRERHTLCISQEHYIEALLESYGMVDCKPIGTPLQSNIPLEPGTPEDLLVFSASGHNYRRAVGSLNYLSQCTRPDLSHSVSLLSQFLEKPTLAHWSHFKRVLRYLRGTSSLCLTYGVAPVNPILTTFQASVDGPPVAFSDSNWAGCQITRRSTSGYVFLFNGGAISWRCKKQPVVALSSTEAEYKGFLDAGQEGLWIRRLMKTFGFENLISTTLFGDNQGSISLSRNPVFHARTKHIEIHFHWIREKLQDKSLDIKYCPTEHMVADVLTKSLDKGKLEVFRRDLGLMKVSSLDSEGGFRS